MTPEEIYDAEIAPILLQVGELVQKHGMSIICTVEWDRDGSGCTRALSKDHSPFMKTMYYASQCRDGQGFNIDRLLIVIMRDVRKNGEPHSSMCLQQLGVNADPSKRKSNL